MDILKNRNKLTGLISIEYIVGGVLVDFLARPDGLLLFILTATPLVGAALLGVAFLNSRKIRSGEPKPDF